MPVGSSRFRISCLEAAVGSRSCAGLLFSTGGVCGAPFSGQLHEGLSLALSQPKMDGAFAQWARPEVSRPGRLVEGLGQSGNRCFCWAAARGGGRGGRLISLPFLRAPVQLRGAGGGGEEVGDGEQS